MVVTRVCVCDVTVTRVRAMTRQLKPHVEDFFSVLRSRLFPKGLPEQYVFVATFRLTDQSPSSEVWSLMKVNDKSGRTQVDVKVNPSMVSSRPVLDVCSTMMT